MIPAQMQWRLPAACQIGSAAQMPRLPIAIKSDDPQCVVISDIFLHRHPKPVAGINLKRDRFPVFKLGCTLPAQYLATPFRRRIYRTWKNPFVETGQHPFEQITG